MNADPDLMPVPPFVRRAVLRVLTGGLVCAVAVAVVGVAGERIRFGSSPEAASARIERDVRGAFAELAAQLESAVLAIRSDPGVVPAIDRRDAASIRALFNRLSQAQNSLPLDEAALTIYGLDARPIAWHGRSNDNLPIVRIAGPPSLFLAPSPLGLRLTRVEPILDPAAPDRRIGSIVAEAPLPRSGGESPQDDFVIGTSVVPVPLRPRFEGATASPSSGIVVTSAAGEPIAALDLPASAIETARGQWRMGVLAAEAAVLCAMLLLLTGPLLDWRRLTRRVGAHAAVTVAILGLLGLARAIAWFAVRFADLDRPALASPQQAGPFWPWLASPSDFLLTSLFFGAAIGVAASSFEQWRQSRRTRVRRVPGGGPREVGGFVAAQLAAGTLVGSLITGYEAFLRTRLSDTPFDLIHFSLHPLDPPRLAVAISLVILHAALLALAVLILRVARARWVVALDYRWVRALIPGLWAAPAVAVIATWTLRWDRPPVVPAVIVLGVAIAAAWRLRQYRAALEHASQATRLVAFFVAIAAPSIFFYPSLVDAAGRARRQLVETRYAPEVLNQRRNLQLQLGETLDQIRKIPDIADLVNAGEAADDGSPSTDAAYVVWRRTRLAELRLTSSVELHDSTGSLVSRFALKLPQAGAPQIYNDAPCDGETFEEVSRFFAEERRLLHGGMSICSIGPSGQRVIRGTVSAHVMLDYSNLSFISAQSPYVAMLRAPGSPPAEPDPREAVEFTVYGWSRRPLYMSGRDAWPLTEETFQRIFAPDRQPFWAPVVRNGEDYDVYFLNDRGAIYALGYPRTGAFGHLISMAELIALAVATYVLLLIAGFVYSFIAARMPTSGRELLREVRASFYRKLFIAFVAASVVPVVVLALITREYVARLMQADLEMEATRTAASASRVVEDAGIPGMSDAARPQIVDDNLVVWLSRIIAQDVNIFVDADLVASSERNLFAAGLLPERTPSDVYRAIILDGRPSYVMRESGNYPYLVAAAPVRVQNRDAILTVPLTLRQQEIEAQTDELDRRVLLAVVLFVALGAAIGYSLAERIADPVNRLMKATGRIARGDLDARILASSSDEFRRLVEAFNRMAGELQQQRAELERSNRLAAWADMARQVAHDIKNPLTPIQLNAEHLRRVHDDKGAPVGQVVNECVNNILTQVKLLRSIASEFSSFASSPTARPEPAALHALIRDVVEPYRAGLAGRVTIDAEVPETLPLVMVDRSLLARALTNIVENALHAMPSGGVLRVAAHQIDAGRVELAIADTGVGMDQAALDRIFEPYFSTRATGTGLGLTIAKRNVELNGGTIQVESERGKGTRVQVMLPTA